MPHVSAQKLKLLYLLQILQERSDEQHPLSMAKILEELSLRGIEAERKAIYRDLDSLEEAGYEIEQVKGRFGGYYLVKSGLQAHEVGLLIDAIQSNKFLSETTVRELCEKLKSQVSIYEQEKLNRSVQVPGRDTKQTSPIFKNLDLIYAALSAQKKLCFKYYKYTNALKREARHNGQLYTVSPLNVGFVEGFYYLMSWSDEREDFVLYRVDRMDDIQVLDEGRTHNRQIATQSLQDFSAQSFGMFDGEAQSAHLLVAPGAMDILVDRFGRDLRCYPNSDGSAQVNITVRISPQFFGWLAGLSPQVKLIGPKALLGEYHSWLKGLIDQSHE